MTLLNEGGYEYIILCHTFDRSRDEKDEDAPQTPSSGYSTDRQRSVSAEGRDRLDARSKHFFQTTEFKNLSAPMKKDNHEPAGNAY